MENDGIKGIAYYDGQFKAGILTFHFSLYKKIQDHFFS